jgi:quinol monooxygenase YgiN
LRMLDLQLAARWGRPRPGRNTRRHIMAAADPAYLDAQQAALGYLLRGRRDLRGATARLDRLRADFGLARVMQISWWVELVVRPGCLDEFETLTGEMVISTQGESGVLGYQRFISEDRQTVYVSERYENSDAAVAHLVKFAATFGERYRSLVERKRFIVFGEPSDALRTLLDRYGASYHRPFGPFRYWG